MKKLTAVFLALVMVLSLAACTAVQNLLPGKSDGGDTTAQVSGETFDAGRISVLVPSGWNAIPQHDVFSDDPNTMLTDVINVCKGGSAPEDLFSKPYIRFDFGGKDKTLYMADKDFYEDVVDLEPLTTGDHTWNGYSCNNYGTPLTVLFCEEGEIQYQASVFTETSGGKISLEDADVLAILASIAPTSEEDAAASEGPAAGAAQQAEESSDNSALYSRFRGDWHGMVGFRNCTDGYAQIDNADYPAIARFKVDSDGEIHPFIAIYVENTPFENLSAEWDTDYDAMRLRGTWQTADFDELIWEKNGTLSVEIPVTNTLGSLTLVLNFRRLDDTGWTDEDPRLTETTIERCMGMSFDDLAEMFEIPFTDYPSEDVG